MLDNTRENRARFTQKVNMKVSTKVKYIRQNQ